MAFTATPGGTREAVVRKEKGSWCAKTWGKTRVAWPIRYNKYDAAGPVLASHLPKQLDCWDWFTSRGWCRTSDLQLRGPVGGPDWPWALSNWLETKRHTHTDLGC